MKHEPTYSDLVDAAPYLYKALKAMLDAFYEDPLEADTSKAVEMAYDAIEFADGEHK